MTHVIQMRGLPRREWTKVIVDDQGVYMSADVLGEDESLIAVMDGIAPVCVDGHLYFPMILFARLWPDCAGSLCAMEIDVKLFVSSSKTRSENFVLEKSLN